MGEVRLLTGMAVLHYDNLCIDPNQRRVYVNGRVIKMTTMEFNILYYLASHPGWTFTREQLYQYAMPDDFAAGPESVTSRICKIRKKLKMLIDFRQQPTKCGLYGSALPLIQSQEQRESVGKGT